MAKKQSNKVQPVEQVRIGGIKAAIWRNEGNERPWFNVTFQRLYRTQDGQWQSTASFAQSDLLALAKVADAAHSRILRLTADDAKARQSDAA